MTAIKDIDLKIKEKRGPLLKENHEIYTERDPFHCKFPLHCLICLLLTESKVFLT